MLKNIGIFGNDVNLVPLYDGRKFANCLDEIFLRALVI